MATRTAKVWTALDVATAADLNKLAGGWIGYAQNSVDQTGITGTVDVTSCTVTTTVGTSRYIKISGWAHVTTVGTCTYYIEIHQDGVAVGRIARETAIVTATTTLMNGSAMVVAPSAGSHTYKLVAVLSSGTSLTIEGGTTVASATILVEDCGAV